jgi:hypothetical protein
MLTGRTREEGALIFRVPKVQSSAQQTRAA